MEELSRRLFGLAELSSLVLPLTDAETEVEEAAQALAIEQLWEKRARVAGEMQLLSQQLAPIWQNWPQCLEELRQEQQEQAWAWLDYIQQAAREVAKLDKKTRKVFETMLQQAQQDMLELNHRSNVLKAYLPPNISSSQYSLPAQLSRTT